MERNVYEREPKSGTETETPYLVIRRTSCCRLVIDSTSCLRLPSSMPTNSYVIKLHNSVAPFSPDVSCWSWSSRKRKRMNSCMNFNFHSSPRILFIGSGGSSERSYCFRVDINASKARERAEHPIGCIAFKCQTRRASIS